MKPGLALGLGLLFVAGLLVGLLLREVMIRVLLFALGGIFVAIREYLNTWYKTVTGALIFIAFIAAIGIEATVHFLGRSCRAGRSSKASILAPAVVGVFAGGNPLEAPLWAGL